MIFNKTSKTLFKPLLIINLGVLLVATGCGGTSSEEVSEDSGNSPFVTPTATPEPAATPTPIPDSSTTPTPVSEATPTPPPIGMAPPVPTAEPTAIPTNDSDNDGVTDANDQCPDTENNVAVDTNGCALDLAIIIIGDCTLDETETALLVAHNEARAVSRMCGDEYKAATTPLRWDCKLAQSAYLHSLDMATNNYFDHYNLEGESPFDRMKAAGYVYRYAGENIAAGQNSPQSAVDAWLDSPGHCLNIMSPNFTDMGAGLAINSNSTYRRYWTANFGAPW